MATYDNSFEPERLDPADPELEPDTLIIADQSLRLGFIQLPKLILYARNISRDAKLLYAVLLGYAWQAQRCFPGYQRLCHDMGASENAVRKYMRELEAVGLLHQRRRGQGRTNIYILTDLRTAKIEVQEPQEIRTAKSEVQEPAKTAGLEPQNLRGEVETEEVETEEIKSDQYSNGSRAITSHKIKTDRYGKEKQFRMRSNVDNSARAAKKPSSAPPAAPAGFTRVGQVLTDRLDTPPPTTRSRRGRPPKAPPYIEQVIVECSARLHDSDHTQANITQATRLWRASGLPEAQFVQDVLYQARSLTQAQGNVNKRATDGTGTINRMPYFFRVVEDLLGLREDQPPPQPPELRGR